MKKLFRLHKEKRLLALLPVCIGLIFYGFVSVLYQDKIASFLFFDEYANIIAGFFMTKGKALYSENFFNHQMIPVYISYGLQTLLKPDSLFELISYHRLLIIFFSAFFGMLLILRMRWIALGFVVLYEPLKYYLFGNLYIAESYIVYPLVYLLYLVWQRINSVTFRPYDYLFAAICSWFVIFSREPYAPLALLLFLIVMLEKPRNVSGMKKMAIVVFAVLSFITLISVPLPEYLYQVVYVNYVTVFSDQLSRNAQAGLGLPAIVFYPFYVFFMGESTFMRSVLQLLSGVFLASAAYYSIKTKRILPILVLVAVLTCANLRVITPGVQFYSAFYQIQWIGLLSVSIFLLLNEIWKLQKRIALGLLSILSIGFLYLVVMNPSYFIYAGENQQQLFTYNYDTFYVTGQAIKIMATEESTLFIDLSDSLLFWTADTPSAYPYGVYYPVADALPKYRALRETMFLTKRPDFYYTNCLEGQKYFAALSTPIRESYAPLLFEAGPTCLYVQKALVQSLNKKQLDELKSLRFSIAPEFLTKSQQNLIQ